MKKILLLATIVASFGLLGCEKGEESQQQTFFVQVYTQYENYFTGELEQEQLADKACVCLFENIGKTVDAEKSKSSVVSDGKITYSDGTVAEPKYQTGYLPGVFTLENVKNGSYILWVTYNTYSVFYSSYKTIQVNSDYQGETEKKVFLIKSFEETGTYRFQNW